MRMYCILAAVGCAALCVKLTGLACRALAVDAVCLRVEAGFSWFHCGGAQGQRLVLTVAALAG